MSLLSWLKTCFGSRYVASITNTHTASLMGWQRKLDLLRGGREAEMWNVCGGVISAMDTGCHRQKHTQSHTHQKQNVLHNCRHKVHHSPLGDTFISDLCHKSHSGMRAYLSASLEMQRSPQRAPRHSTCHFQLVPQRESSSTKRKMGAHYWIPLYSQLWNIDQEAMSDCRGPGCATCRPRHTSPMQMSAECRLLD